MKINVKGPVISDGEQWIYDWFGIPAVSPGKVSQRIDEAVRNNSRELTVVINSGGGSVFSASDIYTALKSFNGNVNVEIVGIAASAASVIAMAGTKISMSPTAQLMIHNAATAAWGDYREMDDTSEFLQNVNKSILNAYIKKTGKTEEELKMMMDKETWMTAQQALEHGFIDVVMFEQEKVAVANINRQELVNGVLPPEVIEKVRNELLKNKGNQLLGQTRATIDPIASLNRNIHNNLNKGDENDMTFEELKNNHPELYNQIKNEGKSEGYELGKSDGIQAERSRMKAIDELSMPGNEETLNKAKYETGATAEQVAIEIIKAEKQRGSNFLQQRNDDAAPLNQVDGSAIPQNNENMDAEAQALAAAVNKRRGK